MPESIKKQIARKIAAGGRGKLIFQAAYKHIGSEDAVRQAFSRCAKEQKLVRLAHGIYLYPKIDPSLGVLYPSTEEIAKAIAKRDRARIIPTGVSALQKLGLSTQVPMKVVYMTDGAPRKIKVGKRSITLKKISPRMLAVRGEITGMVISALQEIGEKNVTPDILDKIKSALQREDKKMVLKDADLAPAWIARIIYSIMEVIETK